MRVLGIDPSCWVPKLLWAESVLAKIGRLGENLVLSIRPSSGSGSQNSVFSFSPFGMGRHRCKALTNWMSD